LLLQIIGTVLAETTNMLKYLFFGTIILGLFITFRITEREKKESNSNGGCFFYGYLTLVYEALLILSLGALALAGTGLYRNIIHDSYQATVVDQVEYYAEDEDGGGQLMYTPIVEFTPNDHEKLIRAKLDVSSGGLYEIGEPHRVVYNPKTGDVNSGALSTILLQLAGLLMGIFMFSFIVYGFCYAFYLPLPFTIVDIIRIGFMYTFLPIGLLGMNAGLMYYIYQRLFLGIRADDPLWPLILSIFFSLTLSLATYSMGAQFIKSGKLKEIFVKSE